MDKKMERIIAVAAAKAVREVLAEYNGWTNWDTWEAFNWLTSDEDIYNEAIRRAESGADDLLALIDEELQGKDIDFDEINLDELQEAFLEK